MSEVLKCPKCGDAQCVVTHTTLYMVNTGEHYCHSMKPNDADSAARCLSCDWRGIRKDLVEEGIL